MRNGLSATASDGCNSNGLAEGPEPLAIERRRIRAQSRLQRYPASGQFAPNHDRPQNVFIGKEIEVWSWDD